MEVSDREKLPSGFSMPPPPGSLEQTPKERVLEYIETVFSNITEEIVLPDGKPTITLKRRAKKPAHLFIDPVNGALESNEAVTYMTYSWPGKSVHEAWKFTVMAKVLSIISEALRDGLAISKRDIYYSDPACFGSQRVVDVAVDDIANTIGVDRLALNVEAAAKGLTAGCYRIRTKFNREINPWLSMEDTLVPRMDDIDEVDITDIKWVLILEKEAVFRRLASSGYQITATMGKGILVTAKGYPDLLTRTFVRRLSETKSFTQSVPKIYTLVDCDPDGIAIMATYKYGSAAHTRENSRLNVPSLQWLGLRTSDLVEGADERGDEALLRLTSRDRRKALAMLKNNPVWAADGPEPEWRTELQQMLMLNLKAEIEILYGRDGGLEEWIDLQMRNDTLKGGS
ncbi:hypothetical protein ASPZODRAFT_130484 [Penicilliopsis zonata CBS 506.65]|uniref:DNA topoisomerase (ATP-hydrolyzing) n=1 Tax=Penicilliopsis zonata CBS 506.65 TaxID=1073090 RepID=A0A1L9SMW4_9EURO|nr:hypothetical protein ASPZODRAFT_130484 [Penicilliopsis zonata CBS 506.65]OJJ48456.1 hypothetical protein ASPZODRAFT_130484 [Penicilliopsis zonata CBS 506.65]